MYPLKSNSQATLRREREGKMWVDPKGPPHGQEGTAGRGASGKQWEGCVLTISLGWCLRGLLGPCTCILTASWAPSQKDEHPEPGGSPLEENNINQGENDVILQHVPCKLSFPSFSSFWYLVESDSKMLSNAEVRSQSFSAPKPEVNCACVRQGECI